MDQFKERDEAFLPVKPHSAKVCLAGRRVKIRKIKNGEAEIEDLLGKRFRCLIIDLRPLSSARGSKEKSI